MTSTPDKRIRALQVYQAKPNRHTPTLYWKGHWREGNPGILHTKWLGKISAMTEEEALQQLARSLGVDLAADEQKVIESDETLLAKYLGECSSAGLSGFLLSRLDRGDRLKHRLTQLIDELVENSAWLKVAKILREHGAALKPSFASEIEAERILGPAQEKPRKRKERDKITSRVRNAERILRE